MANNNPWGRSAGICPLGFIAVPTPSTPVRLTSNIGIQTQQPGILTPTTHLEQITFLAPTSNVGKVYLVKNGYTRTDPMGVMDILLPGERVSIPDGYARSPGLNPDDVYVDADNAGDGVVARGIR
jgi:hypothetical protein